MSDKKRQPTIQNIPLRTELGRQLREAFVLDACRKNGIKEIDYSELERRLAARLTEWQCDECAHVNEKIAFVCDDCGTPRPMLSNSEGK